MTQIAAHAVLYVEEMPAPPTGNPNGRPKGAYTVTINLSLVKKLALIQCTIKEIGAVLEIAPTTLASREDFQAVYRAAQEVGKSSLRRLQFKLAKTSAGMAIFLGKNYLGQRDDPLLALAATGETHYHYTMNVHATEEELSRELLAALRRRPAPSAHGCD